MKTRRFKALHGKGENVRLCDKISVYDENENQIGCYIIHVNNDGKEYYYLQNKYDLLGTFKDKPKDAIECVQNGYADVVAYSERYGIIFLHAIRFIDRDYGEPLRQKSLEEFKDTKFAYGVKLLIFSTLKDSIFVAENDELLTTGDYKDIRRFESEDEANEYINEIEARSKVYCNEYNDLVNRTDISPAEKNKLFDDFFEKIKEGHGYKSLNLQIVSNSIDNVLFKGNNKRYKLYVVQLIV